MAAPTRTTVVLSLGTTQALAWASSIYLPAVLAGPCAADLHLSRGWFFGAFSAALLVSAALNPMAGGLIDRNGGRGVLVVSNGVFAAGLLGLALASGPVSLALAWAVLGIGMAMGLYEAAFATLAGLYGREARRAITGVTLIGGFASTIGWPATSYLVQAFGWREACVVWASLHLLLGLPVHWLLVPATPARPHEVSPEGVAPPPILNRPMLALMLAFGCVAFVTSAIASHLPRVLAGSGLPPATAIAVAALVGPAQVGARLAEFGLLRRLSPLAMARLATALHPIGALCLVTVGPPAAIAFAVLHGAGNGMLTIARGTLPLELFGPGRYGMVTGLLAAPARIMQAAAPLLFGLLLDHSGDAAALASSGGLSLAACVALFALKRG